MSRYWKSRFFGTGVTAGGGTPPAAPTLAIADNGDGTGGVATITGSTAGSTNTVFGRRLDGARIAAWTDLGNRVGDGTVALALTPGDYLFYVLSQTGAGTAASNLVHAQLTDAAALGLLTAPIQKLRELLAEVPSTRNFLKVTTVDEALAKLRTSYLEDADNLKKFRPFIVVGWDNFSMEKIAAGDRNYLWPAEPRLKVLLCDNDPVPEDPLAGDKIFHRQVEQIVEEITDRAALDDRLAVASVELDQSPARNPREQWKSDVGAYLWCSFVLTYD